SFPVNPPKRDIFPTCPNSFAEICDSFSWLLRLGCCCESRFSSGSRRWSQIRSFMATSPKTGFSTASTALAERTKFHRLIFVSPGIRHSLPSSSRFSAWNTTGPYWSRRSLLISVPVSSVPILRDDYWATGRLKQHSFWQRCAHSLQITRRLH